MDLKLLKNEIERIDKMILENEPMAFLDGLTNNEEYCKSSLKIMWILKEPNSIEAHLNWREHIGNLKTNKGIETGWASTFAKIVYTTKGIFDDKYFNQIPDHNKEPDIIDVLNSIAFINVKKIPGGSSTIKKELKDFFNKNKGILKSQLTLYKPNVIICGNTFEIIKEIFNDENFDASEGDFINYYSNDEKIIIDAYHPNSRVKGLNNELYCNSIIEVVNAWKKQIWKFK